MKKYYQGQRIFVRKDIIKKENFLKYMKQRILKAFYKGEKR